jgi:hypothetical protein
VEHSLAAEVEAERFHAADQTALPVSDGGQQFGEALLVPMEARPIGKIVDVHSPLSCGE